MIKSELATPCVLVDLNILERNIKKTQELCNINGKILYPMTKTHKSTEIAKMQIKAGAGGLLCGTLDECETFLKSGVINLMYAYPATTQKSLARIANLAKQSNFIARIDCTENARLLNEAAKTAGIVIDSTIIIDSGLHRFGIIPEKSGEFAEMMASLKNIRLRGVSTHPGHVYSAVSKMEVEKYCIDEKKSMKAAVDSLLKRGFKPDFISSGSTPTFEDTINDESIKIYHPGNYVFNDMIQVSTETAKECDCALTVAASIVSNPRNGLLIIDAGAKCLGLDKGAHGNSAITNYGKVKNHPELTLFSLSEEVGKLSYEGDLRLKVGDIIEIIPNHSCVPANLTSFIVGCRGDDVIKSIWIDARGNSIDPLIL